MDYTGGDLDYVPGAYLESSTILGVIMRLLRF